MRREIHLVLGRKEEDAAGSRKRCAWVLANESRCGRTAPKNSKYCDRHHWWKQSLAWREHGLEFPEERMAIQEMLAKTVDLVLSHELTPNSAEVIVQACKMLAKIGG